MLKGISNMYRVSELAERPRPWRLVGFCSEECKKKWKGKEKWRRTQLSLLKKAEQDLRKLRRMCKEPEFLAASRSLAQGSRPVDSSQL